MALFSSSDVSAQQFHKILAPEGGRIIEGAKARKAALIDIQPLDLSFPS
jgi:hypothetical protein